LAEIEGRLSYVVQAINGNIKKQEIRKFIVGQFAKMTLGKR